MGERIILPVPERVSATYVVVAPERVPEDAAGTVLDRLTLPEEPPPLELRVTEAGADHPEIAGALEVFCCPDCSPDSGPLLAALAERSASHLAVTATAPPGWPPVHLWAAAQGAGLLAELTGGVPLDASAPRVLPRGWRPEPVGSPEQLTVSDWVCVRATAGPRDHLLSSHGLERFGLPEAACAGVGRHHLRGCARLLNGLAARLVRWLCADVGRRPGPGSRAMPGEFRVTAADAARAEGRRPPREAAEVPLRLRHNGAHLSVLPPQGYPPAAWQALVQEVMCG